MSALGAQLRDYRLSMGVSLRQLARFSVLDVSLICRYESGERRLPHQRFTDLCERVRAVHASHQPLRVELYKERLREAASMRRAAARLEDRLRWEAKKEADPLQRLSDYSDFDAPYVGYRFLASVSDLPYTPASELLLTPTCGWMNQC